MWIMEHPWMTFVLIALSITVLGGLLTNIVSAVVRIRALKTIERTKAPSIEPDEQLVEAVNEIIGTKKKSVAKE